MIYVAAFALAVALLFAADKQREVARLRAELAEARELVAAYDRDVVELQTALGIAREDYADLLEEVDGLREDVLMSRAVEVDDGR